MTRSRHTHLLTFDGIDVMSVPPGTDDYQFSMPLHNFDGQRPWSLCLEPLAPGDSYAARVEQGRGSTEYLQAAGRADAMTIELRKPGGQQWGAEWVRYTVGHPHTAPAPLDVEIPTPHVPSAPIRISAAEVFDADEATALFLAYYRTGTIPDEYTLRPVQGFTADGGVIDLHGVTDTA